MKKVLIDMLFVVKMKCKSIIAILLYIVIIIFIGCIVSINLLSVNVLNEDKIKEELIGKTIIVDDNEVSITRENLLGVKIIWRKTKKNVSDNVNIKIDIVNGDSMENLDGNVGLSYKDGDWKVDNVNFNCSIDISENSNLSLYIEDYFKQKGIKTIDNAEISSSIIKKISKVELDTESIYTGKKFTLSMLLYSGACFQNCSVEGDIYYHNDGLKLKNIDITSNNNIYKEENLDKETMKNVVLSELVSGGVFRLENNNLFKEQYMKFSRDSVIDLEVKDYVIRDDNSIRAEVCGKVYLEEYKDYYNLDGIVSITGKLSSGRKKNSKFIIIQDVPFNN